MALQTALKSLARLIVLGPTIDIGTDVVKARFLTVDNRPLLPRLLSHLHPGDDCGALADTVDLLSGRWGDTADRIVELTCAFGFRRAHLDLVADTSAVDRVTLYRRCRRESGGSPRRLMRATRLMAALILRQRTGRPTRQLAAMLGLTDPRAIGTAVRTEVFGELGEAGWTPQSDASVQADLLRDAAERLGRYVQGD